MIASIFALLQLALADGFAAPNRELRDAQAEFEAVRRMNLPVRHAGSQRCDATVGRFCHWHDSTPPPEIPEPPRITRARDRLLVTLDSAARAMPDDPWLAGQRTRYLIDAKRAEAAVRLECASVPWWCSALRGLALHVVGRYRDADSVYSAALAAMPPALRCEWTDLSLLLESALARELGRLPCAERERHADALWRLAQPLWLAGGNDARTEHFGRHTLALILANSANAHGIRWAGDMRELMLRYGWSELLTRDMPSGGLVSSVSVTGHGREPSWQLYPMLQRLDRVWIDAESWALSDPKARTRYAPRHVTSLAPLPHQLVRIPRGDSMELVVATKVQGTHFLVNTGAGVTPTEARTLHLTVARDTVVVSVEALDTATGRAMRSRYSVAPLACAAACLSDLLLFSPTADDTVTLDEAVERATAPSFTRSEPVGIWWHLVGPRGPVTLELVVEPVRTPALRRTLETLRLTRSRSTTQLRWQTALMTDSASSHVSVQLPGAARGRYRISLSARWAGGVSASSMRELDVRR